MERAAGRRRRDREASRRDAAQRRERRRQLEQAGKRAHDLGVRRYEQGRYEDALAAHRQDLRLMEEAHHLPNVAVAHDNVAITLTQLERFEEAHYHHQKHIEITRSIGDEREERRGHLNEAITFRSQADRLEDDSSEEVREFLLQALGCAEASIRQAEQLGLADDEVVKAYTEGAVALERLGAAEEPCAMNQRANSYYRTAARVAAVVGERRGCVRAEVNYATSLLELRCCGAQRPAEDEPGVARRLALRALRHLRAADVACPHEMVAARAGILSNAASAACDLGDLRLCRRFLLEAGRMLTFADGRLGPTEAGGAGEELADVQSAYLTLARTLAKLAGAVSVVGAVDSSAAGALLPPVHDLWLMAALVVGALPLEDEDVRGEDMEERAMQVLEYLLGASRALGDDAVEEEARCWLFQFALRWAVCVSPEAAVVGELLALWSNHAQAHCTERVAVLRKLAERRAESAEVEPHVGFWGPEMLFPVGWPRDRRIECGGVVLGSCRALSGCLDELVSELGELGARGYGPWWLKIPSWELEDSRDEYLGAAVQRLMGAAPEAVDVSLVPQAELGGDVGLPLSLPPLLLAALALRKAFCLLAMRVVLLIDHDVESALREAGRRAGLIVCDWTEFSVASQTGWLLW